MQTMPPLHLRARVTGSPARHARPAPAASDSRGSVSPARGPCPPCLPICTSLLSGRERERRVGQTLERRGREENRQCGRSGGCTEQTFAGPEREPRVPDKDGRRWRFVTAALLGSGDDASALVGCAQLLRELERRGEHLLCLRVVRSWVSMTVIVRLRPRHNLLQWHNLGFFRGGEKKCEGRTPPLSPLDRA